ncbi:flippase-like domain-containing protein [Tissierella creatinini]|nr:flippase-like domain-containing protein [Tissierella creatinini]TJX61395.1 flippase-like domain-containing protein [Soehngenia saccharolytica]
MNFSDQVKRNKLVVYIQTRGSFTCLFYCPLVWEGCEMMDNKGKKVPFNGKLFRYLLTLIYLIIIIVVFLPKIIKKDEILSIINELNIIFLSLAVIAQILSYFGSGYMLKTLLSHDKLRISVFRGALITMAAASVGLVAGGWISSALVTYYLVPKNKKNEGDAELAGIMPPLFNTIILVIVSFIGALYLVIHHDLSKNQIIFYMSILIIMTLGILGVFYGFFHKNKVKALVTEIIDKVNNNKKHKFDAIRITNKIDNFFNRLYLLSNYKWNRPVFGSFMNILFDIMTLYILFIAADYHINPLILIAGYGITFLIGRGAFFIPGGAGVIEGGMVGIYSNLGLPGNVCVVAVLGYRLLSFWIPSLLGFISMIYLKKIYINKK